MAQIMDPGRTFSKLKNAVTDGIKKTFPIETDNRIMTIDNVRVADEKISPMNHREQKELKMLGKDFVAPVYGDLVLKDREMLSDSGIVIVNCNISKETRQIINKPNIVTKGFIYVKDNIDLLLESENIVKNIIESYITDNYIDYKRIQIDIRNILGRFFYNETESKPMIIIEIHEV
jgi:mRNA degradation ribonuclease J1/J2